MLPNNTHASKLIVILFRVFIDELNLLVLVLIFPLFNSLQLDLRGTASKTKGFNITHKLCNSLGNRIVLCGTKAKDMSKDERLVIANTLSVAAWNVEGQYSLKDYSY